MAEAALLTADDPAWPDALARARHDVHHLPAYVRLDARRTGGTPVAVRYDEAGRVLLLPLLLRAVPGGDRCDAVTPYGCSGPVADTGDSGFWRRAVRATTGLLGTHGVVTALVRLHPLLPPPAGALTGAGTVVRHGETVSIDLTLSADDLRRQASRSHRNQIGVARRAGTTVVVDDAKLDDAWIATLRRDGGASSFPPAWFRRLRAGLGDRVHLAVALSPAGEVLGGNLFSAYAGMMHTHLRSLRDGDARHADALLYHEVRQWGRDRGNRVYHLGGGAGGSADSLFRYKAAIAAGRHDWRTWRVVTDRRAFEKLAGPPTAALMAGRFPPYR